MSGINTIEQTMAVLAEIANASEAYGLVECTVRGKRSIALVKRENDDGGEMEVIPIMVLVSEDLKVKPIENGKVAFPHYQKPN
jgi:hypothetical protein